MESLLASYASSDDEDEQPQRLPNQTEPSENLPDSLPKPSSNPSRILSSLPPPKSSSSSSSTSLFNSLPPPKTPFRDLSQSPTEPPSPKRRTQKSYGHEHDQGPKKVESVIDSSSKSLFSGLPQAELKSSSLFSTLPPPRTKDADPVILPNPLASSNPNPKRVVQFRPPIDPLKSSSIVDEEDEDEDNEKEKQRKMAREAESGPQTSSVKSFLSSIPAPRNSSALGALPSGSGTGRRSILEADVPRASDAGNVSNYGEVSRNVNSGYNADGSLMNSVGAGVDGSSEYAAGGGGDYANWSSDINVNHGNHGGHGDGVNYSNWGGAAEASYNSSYGGGYGKYGSDWAGGSTGVVATDVLGSAETALRLGGKRGRNDAPQQIVEVNQDELIKNRPREDQVKMTGIAFGPSYQPASTKGKPTKLHKRKHQIGALFFDMKQKEMELAERRSRGLLTKAQTQGKYGW